MIIYYSRITVVKKKKTLVGTAALNRPPRLKGVVAKPKYTAPENWDEITYETCTVGTDEEVMADSYTLWSVFRGKKLPGKKEDYEIVKIERLREAGVTVDHYGAHPKPAEVLRPFPKGEPEEKKAVEVIPEVPVPKFNFPPLKFSK